MEADTQTCTNTDVCTEIILRARGVPACGWHLPGLKILFEYSIRIFTKQAKINSILLHILVYSESSTKVQEYWSLTLYNAFQYTLNVLLQSINNTDDKYQVMKLKSCLIGYSMFQHTHARTHARTHTHTHTHTHTYANFMNKSNFKEPGIHWPVTNTYLV